ncbi:ZIP family metal transporter [Galbibacter pacificus]|uniref:ZIP family metal transporter n=1 Tax=Galbibacter pacificus TaxID=2996052 RepID=A0ABT6FVM1_9FLAO|nr:ZIP family metal transporter [Galbibacter pacificus]MDG3583386.1 ZIP family metal transporter [Galbibacter pacificus]MDG3587137.1 ZIP family metal transporter [Galbibacter pacificus]
MLNYLLPILAVLAGYLFVLIFKIKEKHTLKLFLAFSGAFLLSITVFNLFPEVYHHGDPKRTGVFIMMGILLQIFLEFFSKGAEHGHVHLHKTLNQFPWLLFISLSIHAILEGFPIHDHDTLLYGIIIHKIPVAIILSTFFIGADISRGKTAVFLILFSFMTPIGSFIAENFEPVKSYYHEISAIVIGIFLHISTVILFESSEGHKFNLRKLIVILVGIVIAYFI